jgi:hypothetical protein
MEVTLRPLASSALPVTLPLGSTVLGRAGILTIEDKRCSRNQATITVAADHVTLTRHGINPTFYKKGPISEFDTDYVRGYVALEQGVEQRLEDGDRFTLLVHEYPYVVRISQAIKASANDNANENENENDDEAVPEWTAELGGVGKKRKHEQANMPSTTSKRQRTKKPKEDEWAEYEAPDDDDDDDDDIDDSDADEDYTAASNVDDHDDDDDELDDEEEMYHGYGTGEDDDVEVVDEDYDDSKPKRRTAANGKRTSKRAAATTTHTTRDSKPPATAGGDDIAPDGRVKCKYGADCYQKNSTHIERVCGNSD